MMEKIEYFDKKGFWKTYQIKSHSFMSETVRYSRRSTKILNSNLYIMAVVYTEAVEAAFFGLRIWY